jgi:YVTN family beta-propeller protein
MKTSKLLLSASVLLFLASSCNKDDDPSPETPKVTTGVYVLNEGNFGGNNASLSYYSLATKTATTDYFEKNNGYGLGDTGNDILLYGGKIYIVMNVTSTVEIADAFTAKSIRQLSFRQPGGANREPRYAVPYKNKVFVSSYDGTVAVIDTTSLSIEKYITVGKNPDGMVISGDKLYVSNSGGLTADFDSTISVIDPVALTELQKIKVGKNPGSITADNSGNLYVACAGNYYDINPSLVKVSTATNTVVKSADTTVGRIRFYDGLLYVTGGYFGSPYLRTLNTTDFAQTRANFVTDGTVVKVPYGISFDAENGDIYVTDSKGFLESGEVFCFDKTGKKKFNFTVAPGIGPNNVVPIKQ